MVRVNVQRIGRTYDGDIIFIVSENGPFAGGSAKGYEYTSRQKGPVVASLDPVSLDCREVYYTFLERSWYLYLQSYCS